MSSCIVCGYDSQSWIAYPSTCSCFRARDIKVKDLAEFVEREWGHKPKWEGYFAGFCYGCWANLFKPRFKLTTKEVYTYNAYPTRPDQNRMVYCKGEMYEKFEANPKCPWCKKPLDEKKHCDEIDDCENDDDQEDDIDGN